MIWVRHAPRVPVLPAYGIPCCTAHSRMSADSKATWENVKKRVPAVGQQEVAMLSGGALLSSSSCPLRLIPSPLR